MSFRDRGKARPQLTVLDTPPTEKGGLFAEPKEYDEVREAHRREGFVSMFQYADERDGNPRSYDEAGNYLCKACNKYRKGQCAVVEGVISGSHGSCRHWEDVYRGDLELELSEKIDKQIAAYGTTTNPGFGCHRCEYHSVAREEDSEGRTMFCHRGAFRVFPNACCALNDSGAVTDA